MAQMQRIGKHATTVTLDYRVVKVTYHSTDVVIYDSTTGTVTLNSGGWRTATTKTRMNQAANELGLPFQVYQHQGNWFVDANGQTLEFYDNMTINL